MLFSVICITCFSGAAGCEQFARVGVAASDAGRRADMLDAGEPALEDAGGTTRRDAGPHGGCEHPPVGVCDPVANTGCPDELAMQCAVDFASPGLAGYCLFRGPLGAGACLNTLVTESCPPRATCVGSACRTLCFCDDECAQGECCSEPVGERGFRVCSTCP